MEKILGIVRLIKSFLILELVTALIENNMAGLGAVCLFSRDYNKYRLTSRLFDDSVQLIDVTFMPNHNTEIPGVRTDLPYVLSAQSQAINQCR